jgi:hypothetical protein
VHVDLPVAAAAEVLREVGIAPFFARRAHPAMAKLAPVRAALGFRTLMCLAASPGEVPAGRIGRPSMPPRRSVNGAIRAWSWLRWARQHHPSGHHALGWAAQSHQDRTRRLTFGAGGGAARWRRRASSARPAGEKGRGATSSPERRALWCGAAEPARGLCLARDTDWGRRERLEPSTSRGRPRRG